MEIILDALTQNHINYVAISNDTIVEQRLFPDCQEQFYQPEYFNYVSSNCTPYEVSDEEQLKIIDALLSSIDPITGEVFDENHVVNYDVVKAVLYTAKTAIERKQLREKNRPDSAGISWTKEEEEKLIDELNKGLSVKEIAQSHQRTVGAIKSRMQKIRMT